MFAAPIPVSADAASAADSVGKPNLARTFADCSTPSVPGRAIRGCNNPLSPTNKAVLGGLGGAKRVSHCAHTCLPSNRPRPGTCGLGAFAKDVQNEIKGHRRNTPAMASDEVRISRTAPYFGTSYFSIKQ